MPEVLSAKQEALDNLVRTKLKADVAAAIVTAVEKGISESDVSALLQEMADERTAESNN